MKNFIVFDMDDVVVNLREVLCEELNRGTGQNIHWKDWHTFILPDLYKTNMDDLFRHMLEGEVLERATLDPNAHDVFHEVRSMGYQVAVLTSRGWHPNGTNLTMNYFMDHGLEVDDICVVGHGQKKSSALHRYGQVIRFIDDYDKNVEDMTSHGIHSLLMDRPWNQHATHMERIFNLEDVVKHLRAEMTATETAGFWP